MDAGALQRFRIAAAVAAVGVALGALAASVADPARSRGAPPGQLLPDLVVERPHELYLRGRDGHLRLRFSNTVANTGTGPLEIIGGDAGDPSCNLAGRPEGRRTQQAVYEDSAAAGSLGFFRRSDDLGFTLRQAGCSRYHPTHDHWHFDNFARYTLRREPGGAAVGRSRKVSFCVIDTGHPYPELDGSPGGADDPDGRAPYYPQDPDSGQARPSCSATSVDGLSIGWEDTYGAALRGQAIDITGVRRGTYCLVLEVDPRREGLPPEAALLERSETNNLRDLRLRIRPRRDLVRRIGPDCRLPG